MTVFTDFDSFQASHGACVATIGKYDGLHLGHQHVLDTLLVRADKEELPSVVILSEPHPEEFFAGDAAPARLTSFEEKVEFLTSYGVDAIFQMTFNRQLCNLEADDFITRYLVNGLKVRALIVGDDFRFGKNRRGDFSMLIEKGAVLGFDVIREAPCVRNSTSGEFEERISSTLVRKALLAGNCERAREMLGRFYSISGYVEEGRKLGREIGIPTANLSLGSRKLPLQGIFSVLVELNGRILQGVASVGFNPTVETGNTLKVEVYIFDFSEDIYGQHLHVSFVKKLRDEETFADLESLTEQMHRDIAEARLSLAAVAAGT